MKSKTINYTSKLGKEPETDFWKAVYHKVSSFIKYSKTNRMYTKYVKYIAS